LDRAKNIIQESKKRGPKIPKQVSKIEEEEENNILGLAGRVPFGLRSEISETNREKEVIKDKENAPEKVENYASEIDQERSTHKSSKNMFNCTPDRENLKEVGQELNQKK